jgi:hypothetical protein
MSHAPPAQPGTQYIMATLIAQGQLHWPPTETTGGLLHTQSSPITISTVPVPPVQCVYSRREAATLAPRLQAPPPTPTTSAGADLPKALDPTGRGHLDAARAKPIPAAAFKPLPGTPGPQQSPPRSCRVLAAPCDRSTPPRVEPSACRSEPQCTHKPRLCGQPAWFTTSTPNVSTSSQPPPPMPMCARQSSAEAHLEHASHQALSFFSPKSTSLPPPRCFSVGRSLAAATAHASRTVSTR